MLFIIGLGLGDHKDVTLKGREAIERSSRLFLEAYTSILGVSSESLEELYQKPVEVADRDFVETGADVMLDAAKSEDVSFLVVGDALCATTHMDLYIRAREAGIDVQVIHNASIMNAVGSCGLQLYNFGQTVSIPYFTDSWRPDSFYERILYNRNGSMHTLCLVDIKVKEPDFDALMTGKKKWLPPRFMSINTCIRQLLEIEERKGQSAYSEETKCFGLARVGQETQVIASGTMQELQDVDFGPPLHSFVIAGEMHELEKHMYDYFHISKQRQSISELVSKARENALYDTSEVCIDDQDSTDSE